MARPRRDGQPSRKPNRRNLTEKFVERLRPDERHHFLVWDERVRGLVLIVYPTGAKVWRVIYTAGGRTRWYTLGRYAAVKLEDARRLASDVLLRVATGTDPQAERKAKRGQLTFEELNDRYLEQHAKKMNKSWRQSDKQIRRNVLPRWAKLQASSITRADVRALIGRIASPSVSNLTLASVSAIFSFAMKEEIVAMNPCQLVDGHAIQSRERVLSASEIPLFWKAFDSAGLLRGTALKLILLLGQRPGEVLHLRREHVVDGWWEMPGKPVPELNWPGTKNKMNHRVWLPKVARDLLNEVDGDQPFAGTVVSPAMQAICKNLKAERATPHDLRRTHGTLITSLAFGRDAMNRIQNHREGGIGSVYDRHGYAEENKKVMEAVANKIMSLVNGDEDENVIVAAFGR